MERYEYYTYNYDTKGIMGGIEECDFQNQLNDLGKDGWELVNSVATNQGNGYTRSIVCMFKGKIM